MTTAPKRLVTGDRRDDDVDASLRPQKLADFIGQEKARAVLLQQWGALGWPTW